MNSSSNCISLGTLGSHRGSKNSFFLANNPSCIHAPKPIFFLSNSHVKDKKFHLGWFMNFTSDMWTGPFEQGGGTPWDGQFYVEMAKNLERAGFDFIMMEDKLAVSEAFGGTKEAVLKHAVGMVPKHDPAHLATLISASTQHLGVVATLSTLGYPPFLLARMCSTIDHISHGRFG